MPTFFPRQQVYKHGSPNTENVVQVGCLTNRRREKWREGEKLGPTDRLQEGGPTKATSVVSALSQAGQLGGEAR